MKKVVYLTFNDAPSGIYSGQVIDVCKFLEDEKLAEVQLIAFISSRNFSFNKQKIHLEYPSARVVRMFPFVKNWKKNRFALRWMLRRIKADTIIARGAFAASLALRSRTNEKVVFDGRGAYTAEFNEYNVGGDSPLKNEIAVVEKEAVLNADHRIAVSKKLVEYWKKEFQYNADAHVVIPCTLNRDVIKHHQEEGGASQHAKGDWITVGFSGGGGGWQSLRMMEDILRPELQREPKLSVVLMTKEMPDDFALKKEFPDRVVNKWVMQKDVTRTLNIFDYGWLVRENSVTNEVASPVKFAEYLFAGLPVIISEGIGDFSEFVKEHKAGIVWRKGESLVLNKTNSTEKARLQALALEYFSKEKYRNEYKRIIG